MNTCPYGYYLDTENQCTCTMAMNQMYQKGISGHILVRTDIYLNVLPCVPVQKLTTVGGGEPSHSSGQLAEDARAIQRTCFAPRVC